MRHRIKGCRPQFPYYNDVRLIKRETRREARRNMHLKRLLVTYFSAKMLTFGFLAFEAGVVTAIPDFIKAREAYRLVKELNPFNYEQFELNVAPFCHARQLMKHINYD